MSGDVRMVYSISKEAYKLVKAGKAVISKGGIRLLDGTLYELAKPAATVALEGVGSVLGTVSSVANNVQSAFIQKGVNQANQKLDLTLDKLDMIQGTLNSLSKSNMLSWVNCAVGIANCGISLAGFAMTLHKLDEVSSKIDELSKTYTENIQGDRIQEFTRHRMNIQSNVDLMQNERFLISSTTNITDHLNATAAYLKRVIKEFMDRKIDGQLGCTIIFNLSIAFAQEISEFSARYYYENGNYPANYEEWIDVLESIDSDSFKEHLKKFLILGNFEMGMQEKYAIYSGAIAAVEAQIDKMEFTKNVVPMLEKKDYIHIDDYLQNRINKNFYEEIGDRICIPLQPIPKKKLFGIFA